MRRCGEVRQDVPLVKQLQPVGSTSLSPAPDGSGAENLGYQSKFSGRSVGVPLRITLCSIVKDGMIAPAVEVQMV